MRTKKMVLAAALIALHVVLSYVSIDLRVMKFSLAGFPVILAGLLFGPLFGFEVGFIGSFVGQLLRYGLMPTTIIWMMPVAMRGLMVGLVAKKLRFHFSVRQLAATIICTSLIVTGLNTIGIYYDSIINGYYSFPYVFGAVPVRILNDVIMTVLYVAVTPAILKQLSKLELSVEIRNSILGKTPQEKVSKS